VVEYREVKCRKDSSFKLTNVKQYKHHAIKQRLFAGFRDVYNLHPSGVIAVITGVTGGFSHSGRVFIRMVVP